MEDIRPKGAWYAVHLNVANGAKPAVVDVHKLADILPHGSGIDGGWTIEVRRNGDVCCHGEYHAMNENGMYDGWRNFRFTLAQCKQNVYQPLSGPCAGQWQVTKVKGRVYYQSFVGGGDAADYLHDTCYWAVRDLLGPCAIESIVVGSEQAAKEYK